jgi:hypothetical protein
MGMCSFPAGGKNGRESLQTWHNPRLLKVSWPPEMWANGWMGDPRYNINTPE